MGLMASIKPADSPPRSGSGNACSAPTGARRVFTRSRPCSKPAGNGSLELHAFLWYACWTLGGPRTPGWL